jgi:hypothetical protein
MLQLGPSMKSETVALEGERQRLQLLVGELLLKNHQLRCEVARLREEEKLQMQPVRFAVSKTIFDWESIG